MQPAETAPSAKTAPSRAPLVGECLMGALAVAAALWTNSTALEAHAARVGLDALVCLVALLAPRSAARVAGEPADKGEALAILGVVLSLAVVLAALLLRGADALLAPRPPHGAAAGMVALGAAVLSQFVFWTRFHRLHVATRSPAARRQSRVWANAVSLSLFAFVAVAAGVIERGEHPWLWSLDPVAGLLLALSCARSLWDLGRRALRVLFAPGRAYRTAWPS